MPAHKIMLPKKWYTETIMPGATWDRPGVLEWRIEGVGSCFGHFDSDSRVGDFARNLQRLLNGEAYRPKDPEGFRRIHHALADAIRTGTKIELIVLENPPTKEERYQRIRELKAERGNLNG